jgi:hypothetical protein
MFAPFDITLPCPLHLGCHDEVRRHAAVTNPRICTGWPNHPEQPTQTKMQGVARTAIRQQQYNEGMFLAHLAEVLQ